MGDWVQGRGRHREDEADSAQEKKALFSRCLYKSQTRRRKPRMRQTFFLPPSRACPLPLAKYKNGGESMRGERKEDARNLTGETAPPAELCKTTMFS